MKFGLAGIALASALLIDDSSAAQNLDYSTNNVSAPNSMITRNNTYLFYGSAGIFVGCAFGLFIYGLRRGLSPLENKI